ALCPSRRSEPAHPYRAIGQRHFADGTGPGHQLRRLDPQASVPTRSDSDKLDCGRGAAVSVLLGHGGHYIPHSRKELLAWQWNIVALDRKSTRLNSSHVKISYAVFCLKKKK